MEFVTNIFTTIISVLGIIILLSNSKMRNNTLSWVQLIYSFGLIIAGVFLCQHEIAHYIGASFVFVTSFAGFYLSIKTLFAKTN
jgi:hypothetical protein